MNDTPKKTKVYKFSPFGQSVFPHVNKPDTKFNEAGIYKTGLVVGGPEGDAWIEGLKESAEAAFNEHMDTIPAKDRKNWSVYYPYEEDADDEGNATGYYKADFKQNAQIKLKDGTVKDIQIGIWDSKNKVVRKPVYGGSEIRVKYAERVIVIASPKKVGIRLDFSDIQVKKLETAGKRNGAGFGTVEDGYSSEEDQEYAANEAQEGSAEGSEY